MTSPDTITDQLVAAASTVLNRPANELLEAFGAPCWPFGYIAKPTVHEELRAALAGLRPVRADFGNQETRWRAISHHSGALRGARTSPDRRWSD